MSSDQSVAIISAGGSGIGLTIAQSLHELGYLLFIVDIDPDHVAQFQRVYGEGSAKVCDVSDPHQVDEAFTVFAAQHQRLDLLVNNAGIIGPITHTADLSLSDYLHVCNVNQVSVFLGMQAVIPSMVRAGGGSIINISSISGMVAIVGSPNLAYVGSKFAVRGMTKQVAVEYGRAGIRVNSIHPGYTKTPMMVSATDEDGGGAAEIIPLGRFADPEEVSNLIVFLASDESRFITGAEHIIDGGMTAV